MTDTDAGESLHVRLFLIRGLVARRGCGFATPYDCRTFGTVAIAEIGAVEVPRVKDCFVAS